MDLIDARILLEPHVAATAVIWRKDFLGAQNAMFSPLNTSREHFIHMEYLI